ncbi:MAG: GNAT family N-acetyltransferase [Anaerolineae bacterium]|nr:GNAT family N-acetyltransferase [Anaerolineae bacterium]
MTERQEIETIRDLGDGLVLRRGRREDTEALVKLYGQVFCNRETREPNPYMAAWTRDMLTRPHPTIRPQDFTVVQRTEDGEIVSALVLISQTWAYEDVEFGVGRPEAVATLPEYRRRGLVRAQFDVVHRWSAQRGELVQGVTGIPNFYRQFGYEMTMDLGGWRSGAAGNVPGLKEGQEEPFTVRPASEDDLSFIAETYAYGQRRSLVSCVRDEEVWRLELNGRSENSSERRLLRIVQTVEGEPVGFLAHGPRLGGNNLYVVAYELKPGISWLAVTPSVLRYIKRAGEEMARADEKQAFHTFSLGLGGEHPAYKVAGAQLPAEGAPYAWYLRVPDLPRFLMHIRPVLERRLAESIAPRHTGELKLSFYRGGLKLTFSEGRLERVEPWQPSSEEWGDAGFPGLTFLHLVFGYRTLEELRHVYPDCGAQRDEARVLLEALFPKKPSAVWPLS